MAKITFPAGMTAKDTAGGPRFYWQPSPKQRRAGWKGLPLGLDLAEAIKAAGRRNDEILRWQAGGAKPAAVKRILRKATLSAAIAQFKAAGWPSVKNPGKPLEPGTIKEYRSKFRTLEAWAGDAPLAMISKARVRVLRDALMQPAKGGRRKGEVRHTSAHATLRVGRSFFTWCEQEGMIPEGSNPFASFGLAAPDPRDEIWSPEAREVLVAEALAAGAPNMALAIDLAFAIGQREGDMLVFLQSQYREIPPHKMDPDVYRQLAAASPAGDVKGLRLRQRKGKRWVEVPVVGEMRARIEAEIARAKAASLATILFDDRAMQPWTLPNLEAGQNRFQDRFAELRDAAIRRLLARYADEDDHPALDLAIDLADLQYRDFRRTAVVYLGELGLADHLIAAITGHTLDETKKILETYMPRTTGMAARAIALSHARAPTAKAEQENVSR